MELPCDVDDWLEKKGVRILAQFSLTKSENWSHRHQQGAWFDLEGLNAWGRVTFWPDGKADMEVLDVKTGETKFYWAGKTLCDNDLAEWLSALDVANVR
jgi:hypothetical protein